MCYKLRRMKGESGRIVVQVQPLLKRELHSALALNGQTLKDWFIEAANTYLSNRNSTNGSNQKSKKADVKSSA